MADAETVLRALLNKIALEHNFDEKQMTIKTINSGGANYTSVLFLVSVKVPGQEDVELFAKVACLGEKLRKRMQADKMFYLESFFYNKLSKTYQELEQKQGISDEGRLVIPKFYGCNRIRGEESVVLQNLVAEGYGSYDRFISVDWAHAASSIEALAKFHALSFAYQKANPKEFAEVAEDLKYVDPTPAEEIMQVFGPFMERAISVVKEEHRPKIQQFMKNMSDNNMLSGFLEPLKVKVIVHGDYRPSNLLYKKQDDKVHAIPVDYQTLRTGSAASDILYFEMCGTDSKFRAEHHDRLIDHYYNELSAALQRLGVDPTEVYPREMLDREMKQLLPYTLVMGAFVLPIVLVEEQEAPKTDGEKGMESFMVPSTDLFVERFTGIVEDCVRQGAI